MESSSSIAISHENWKDDVVIIDCPTVEGYSRMCNHAWKGDIGRWFLPHSVFHTYHDLSGYNKKLAELLMKQEAWTENKE